MKRSCTRVLLVFSCHRLARQLFNRFFGPVLHAISRHSYHYVVQDEIFRLQPKHSRSGYVSEGERTHISPSATMQIVCQTPKPIRGVTPR